MTTARFRLAAMAAFGQKSTGIENVVIWLIPGDGGKHGPRIKVSNIRGKASFESADCFSVSIPSNPSSNHCWYLRTYREGTKKNFGVCS